MFSCLLIKHIHVDWNSHINIITNGAGCLYVSVYMYVFVADRENIFGQTFLCNVSNASTVKQLLGCDI